MSVKTGPSTHPRSFASHPASPVISLSSEKKQLRFMLNQPRTRPAQLGSSGRTASLRMCSRLRCYTVTADSATRKMNARRLQSGIETRCKPRVCASNFCAFGVFSASYSIGMALFAQRVDQARIQQLAWGSASLGPCTVRARSSLSLGRRLGTGASYGTVLINS